MGRKIIYLAAALLLCAGSARAQRGLPGQVGLTLWGGTVDGVVLRDRMGAYRFWTALDAVRYTRAHGYWSVGVTLLRKDYTYRGAAGRERVPMAQATVSTGYAAPVVSDRRRVFTLLAAVEGLAGSEVTGWGDKALRDGSSVRCRDGLVGGGAISAIAECYLADRLQLLLRVRERCLAGSDTGAFHTELGFGIRIIIR